MPLALLRDRGRPARKRAAGAQSFGGRYQFIFALRAHLRAGARVLTEELELFSRAPMPGSEYFRLALSGDSCFQIRLPLRQLLSHPFQRCLCGIGE